MYRELYHFNKNHDPNTGQFTTAAGRALSPGPKGKPSDAQKMASSGKDGIRAARDLEMHTRKRGTYDLSNMSDEDLRKEINRMNMEQQYANLKDAEISAGRRNVHDSLQVAEDVAGLGVSAAVIASLIYKARKGI